MRFGLKALGLLQRRLTDYLRKNREARRYRDFNLKIDAHRGVQLRDNLGGEIWISHPSRIAQYPGGVEKRLEKLQIEYSLSRQILGSGAVVDIGANVGELGMLAEREGSEYFAFEPDPLAFAALRNNVSSEHIYEFALSNFNGQAVFGLKSESADSSLLLADHVGEQMQISVPVRRLDHLLEEIDFPPRVGLLKVEAEGSEPEVLQGASKFLERVAYCAVDAGPEREGLPSAPEVVNFMMAHGFRLLDVYLRRGTFLFVNDAL